MEKKKEATAEIRELPSGFWAVFIDGSFVDAASASREAAEAKLNLFLQSAQNRRQEKEKLSLWSKEDKE